MILSMRQLVQRGGILSAVCLAVLGIVVLLHLGLCVAAPPHAAHHHEFGAEQPTAACGMSAAHHAPIGTTAFQGGMPCPQLPSGDDHTLCGATSGSPITDVRVLIPGERIACDSVTVEATAAASLASAQRSSQPVRPLPGAALLLLKSVSRI